MTKKKKILIIVVAVIAFLIAMPLLILFTSPGNKLLMPFVESQINQKSPIQVTLTYFRLYPSYIMVKGNFAQESNFEAEGDFSMISKSFDIDYKVHVGALKPIAEVFNQNLSGSFDIDGNVKGTQYDFIVNGKTNLARSLTHYNLHILNSQIDSIDCDSKSLHIEDIFSYLCKPKIFNGLVDLKLSTKNIKDFPQLLQGNINLQLSNGVFNNQLLAENFDIILSDKIPISLDFNANAKNNSINTFLNVSSKIANCKFNGIINPLDQKCDLTYNLNTTNLELLEPFIKQQLNGPFQTSGMIKGFLDDLKLKGLAHIANGNVNYDVQLNNLKPHTAIIIFKDLSLKKLLHCLNKPVLADGKINGNANVQFSPDGLIDGKANVDITKGNTFPEEILHQFKMHDVALNFNFHSKTLIKQSITESNISLKTSAGNVTTEKTMYNIPVQSLNSDFKIDIDNLDSLSFLTKRHLQGNALIIGNIKKNKDLIVNAESKIFDGEFKLKLINNNLKAKCTNIQSIDLLKTLIYPEIFNSTINADIDYNLKNNSGKLYAELLKGAITNSAFSTIIKQTTKFDITKEIYEKTTLDGTIKKLKFVGNLNMKSKLTTIKANDTSFNLKNNKINAEFKIKVKKKPFTIKVKGNVKDPHIGIDVSDLLNKELEKKIEKQVPKKHKKAIKAIFNLIKDNL